MLGTFFLTKEGGRRYVRRRKLLLCVLFVFLALFVFSTSGCKGRQPEHADPNFDCRGKDSRDLALSHLKEADHALENPTVKSALYSVILSSRGLSCAPPAGRAEAWMVARLLLVRARASAALQNPEDSLSDLEASLAWAHQGRSHDPLLLTEIHLEIARAHLGLLQHDEALKHVRTALSSSTRLGKEGAHLTCEALLLEGDVLLRLGESPETAEALYRRVFEVAERHGYPEATWDYLDSAVARLGVEGSSQEQILLGPVPELRAAKEADDEEKELLASRDGRPTRDMVHISKGFIPNADQTVAGMRAGFRECYQKQLSSGGPGGQATLIVSVGAGGVVEQVSAQNHGMDPSTIECLTAEAKRARFDPPRGGHAVLQVPVTLVRQ